MSKKSSLSNIRTASAQGPVLVSPISVAHRVRCCRRLVLLVLTEPQNKALEADGGKKGDNHVRAQWIANLKKKSMASEAAGGSGGAALSDLLHPNASSHHHHHHQQPQSTHSNNQHHHHHASMLLASESLGHPSFLDHDYRGGVKVEPKTSATASGSGHIDLMPKKWIKPLLKKRNNALDLHNAPKPRTPRRKLNCGNAFEDMQIQTDAAASWATGFPGVGTPSSHYHHVHPAAPMDGSGGGGGAGGSSHHLFGHDIDFGNFDTFLDLPTPKAGIEMPSFSELVQDSGYHVPPTLVRTTSVEQEGLSYCFEQTHLNNQQQHHGHHAYALVSPLHRHSPDRASIASTAASSSTSPPPAECIFDHTKHPELESMFDDYEFNDADIDKEVDNFYMDNNELEIDLIA
ncbi:Aste57867_16435 [Aphanomyces stellatus]|uniref:Aste57867_16435 protein n=1 Tax=Aphanomyces stellatus TaxID=120398 RepID=A0A485L5N0_9STRA|nr:hypothetical protein As57867_016378 [Aphanomyces stellatus]VFT93210.1 Aste57867_16435 [Aphanomyces stellatus]